MKKDRGVEYRCDKCRRNITGRRHIRILMGFTSGIMVPPFDGGMPIASLVDRKPEWHFCKTECFTLFFTQKLNEISANSREYERADRVRSALGNVLAKAGTARSRVQGSDHMGARDTARRKKGERTVGDRILVRIGSRGGSISGLGNDGEADRGVDRIVEDNGLGGSGSEVPAQPVAAAVAVPNVFVRALAATRRGIAGVLP